jgi:hypothetical protein
MTTTQIKLFEQNQVRTYWDEQKEEWFFSVIDVIAILSESVNPRDYWFKMKQRVLLEDGIELSTICRQLKLTSSDGKKYNTDCANVQALFRVIQSIPSPKAEPFKQWLAKVGYERIQETIDPSQSIDRARDNWQRMGRSKKWVQQRMTGQETRNKLTDYWKETGIKETQEFAALTNIIHKEWSGLTVSQHKGLKNLKSQNLRDHMTEAELIFTALAELSTRQIAEREQAKGYNENAKASKKGGKIAKNARKELEKQTGKPVITDENFLLPAEGMAELQKINL